jgi:predicted signal transduction protein with EAL and GGDEF domain
VPAPGSWPVFKQLGVMIAMDDFGTGYSSLSNLRRFPFDKIKIDKSFVQESCENADSLAIVKAVISLGHSLGMSTTAEGVETEAQLSMIREQGCTEVQGFLLSAPLPLPAVKHLLSRFRPGRGALLPSSDRRRRSGQAGLSQRRRRAQSIASQDCHERPLPLWKLQLFEQERRGHVIDLFYHHRCRGPVCALQMRLQG